MQYRLGNRSSYVSSGYGTAPFCLEGIDLCPYSRYEVEYVGRQDHAGGVFRQVSDCLFQPDLEANISFEVLVFRHHGLVFGDLTFHVFDPWLLVTFFERRIPVHGSVFC
jgi:hypothetical protein